MDNFVSSLRLVDVCSVVVFIIVVVSWLRPMSFRYLLDKGNAEPSLSRIGQFTALLFSTWAGVVTILNDKMTEWFWGMYMAAWVGAQFGSIYMKVKNSSSAQPPTT